MDGKLVLRGWIGVADGFGELEPGWQKNILTEVTLPVERQWFRVVISSGATVPYRKAG